MIGSAGTTRPRQRMRGRPRKRRTRIPNPRTPTTRSPRRRQRSVHSCGSPGLLILWGLERAPYLFATGSGCAPTHGPDAEELVSSRGKAAASPGSALLGHEGLNGSAVQTNMRYVAREGALHALAVLASKEDRVTRSAPALALGLGCRWRATHLLDVLPGNTVPRRSTTSPGTLRSGRPC
jgi:hypothetical protein